MDFDADEVYNNLPEEEKKAIEEEAIKRLEETNPYFNNRKVSFMKKTLILIKVREIVFEKYGGVVNA
ncbi:MAG TPA: hypothetical protein PL110_21050 [Candidatus Eremiobacteraeota bacterium]|nr:MAG: hypothetical protein BWY64_03229 [bacterium ADurb.Bin363]HPZ10590.1 hypothetical protein [Candidatus Eremiobacteraeota bacterium]